MVKKNDNVGTPNVISPEDDRFVSDIVKLISSRDINDVRLKRSLCIVIDLKSRLVRCQKVKTDAVGLIRDIDKALQKNDVEFARSVLKSLKSKVNSII